MTESEIAMLCAQLDHAIDGLQQLERDAPIDESASRGYQHARVAQLREALAEHGVHLTDPPVSMGWTISVSVATWNMQDLDLRDEGQRTARAAVLAELGADVLCVQELLWHTDDPHDPELHSAFDAWCAELGLHGRLAWARSGCHVAVLWRPERAVLLGWRDYRHWPWHHTLGRAEFDIGARRTLIHASAHFSPFSGDQRAHEALLTAAVTPADPLAWMILGADLNSIPEGAPEPYRDQRPGGRHELFQRIHSPVWPATSDLAPVDRRAAETLDRAGLRDALPPEATSTGHHPSDPHGPRRPDCLRSTLDADRIVGARAHDTDTARATSDHLPLTARLHVPWRPTFTHATDTLTAGTA